MIFDEKKLHKSTATSVNFSIKANLNFGILYLHTFRALSELYNHLFLENIPGAPDRRERTRAKTNETEKKCYTRLVKIPACSLTMMVKFISTSDLLQISVLFGSEVWLIPFNTLWNSHDIVPTPLKNNADVTLAIRCVALLLLTTVKSSCANYKFCISESQRKE